MGFYPFSPWETETFKKWLNEVLESQEPKFEKRTDPKQWAETCKAAAEACETQGELVDKVIKAVSDAGPELGAAICKCVAEVREAQVIIVDSYADFDGFDIAVPATEDISEPCKNQPHGPRKIRTKGKLRRW